MGQTAFTARMDANVKKMFDDLCKNFGKNAGDVKCRQMAQQILSSRNPRGMLQAFRGD